MNHVKGEMHNQSTALASSATGVRTLIKTTDESKANNTGSGGHVLPAEREEFAAVSESQVSEAISKINQYVQEMERTLDFQVDEDSGKTVIRVYDNQSSKLIRQIPSELALMLAQKLNDDEPSLLFSAKV